MGLERTVSYFEVTRKQASKHGTGNGVGEHGNGVGEHGNGVREHGNGVNEHGNVVG